MATRFNHDKPAAVLLREQSELASKVDAATGAHNGRLFCGGGETARPRWRQVPGRAADWSVCSEASPATWTRAAGRARDHQPPVGRPTRVPTAGLVVATTPERSCRDEATSPCSTVAPARSRALPRPCGCGRGPGARASPRPQRRLSLGCRQAGGRPLPGPSTTCVTVRAPDAVPDRGGAWRLSGACQRHYVVAFEDWTRAQVLFRGGRRLQAGQAVGEFGGRQIPRRGEAAAASSGSAARRSQRA